MEPIRIAILSDNRLFREGLLRIVADEPAFSIVGHGERGASPPETGEPRADVLLLDGRTEEALALCAALERQGRPKVLFLGAPCDDDWAVRALGAGARGILERSGGAEDLVKAIRVVHAGQIWARRQVMLAGIGRRSSTGVAGGDGDGSLERRLSSREREVFRQAATGLSNKELADRLAISQATVKVHLTHIFLKLGLRGRAELAAAYHGVMGSAPDARLRAKVPRIGRTAKGIDRSHGVRPKA